MIERFGSLFRFENRLCIDHCNIFGDGPYVSPVHRHHYAIDLRIEGPLDGSGFVVGHENASNEDSGFFSVLNKWNNKLVIPCSSDIEVVAFKDASGRDCEMIRWKGESVPCDAAVDPAYRFRESLARHWVFDGNFYCYNPYEARFVEPGFDKFDAFRKIKVLKGRGFHGSSEEIARELLEDFMRSALDKVSSVFYDAEFSFVIKLFEEGKHDGSNGGERKFGAYYMRRGTLVEILDSVGLQ